MALSVTRHTRISRKVREEGKGKRKEKGKGKRREKEKAAEVPWTFLVCGIDSLYLSLLVMWDEGWPKLLADMEKQKEMAQGTGGILWAGRGGSVLFLPAGKPPMYRFHVQIPEAHLFIAKSDCTTYPNIYVSIAAHSLWCNGVTESVDLVKAFIKSLGGTVVRLKVSRCDLCADYLIPGGLETDFLRRGFVAKSGKHRPIEQDGQLETYYVGDAGSVVQLRIYDKSKQIEKEGTVGWFKNVWGIDVAGGVWRVEFQLRRLVLNQLGINTLEDLLSKRGEIWKYLTEEWASIRYVDNENQTRRTVHEWWIDVQNCGGEFIECKGIARNYAKESTVKARWFVSHVGGCLVTYAALKGTGVLEAAGKELLGEIGRSEIGRTFEERFREKCIKLGRRVVEGGERRE